MAGLLAKKERKTMSTNTHDMINEAIGLLTEAMRMLTDRLTANETLVGRTISERQVYKDKTVQFLLPDTSVKTLAKLEKELPGFLTAPTLFHFKNNKKTWGLFAGKHYRKTVALLQTHLSSYFDVIKYGKLREIDGQLERFYEEQRKLNERINQSAEFIKSLSQAKQRNKPLPHNVVAQIRHIINTAEKCHQQSNSVTGSDLNSSNQEACFYIQDDYSDLWFYIITDIPTSVRTLMIDWSDDHKREMPDPVDNDRTTDYINEERANKGIDSDADSHSGDDNDFNMDGIGAAAVGIVAGAVVAELVETIATDDSLGHFS
jgi:hypothetical protein